MPTTFHRSRREFSSTILRLLEWAFDMRKFGVTALIASSLCTPSSAFARSAAAKELVRQLRLETHSATRKDQDFYELTDGYVVKTKYCYVYAYSSSVVIAGGKLIFIDDDDVCDVDGIHRK